MSKIIKTYKAKSVREGAGVIVNRVFGYYEVDDFDPFLMLDYFESDEDIQSPGFPWHPHKGIETITYMLRGRVQHEDSLGNKGIIGANELQWMTAGKGIMHQEMPMTSPKGYQGFQFWVNLPASQKLVDPKYTQISASEMGIVKNEAYEVRVISGNYQGALGPIDKSNLGINMYHVILNKKQGIKIERMSNKKGFIFLFSGEGLIGSEKITRLSAYALDHGEIEILNTGDEEMAFIFAEGIALGEPIAWSGPVVMNTKEEIKATFKAIHDGTFV